MPKSELIGTIIAFTIIIIAGLYLLNLSNQRTEFYMNHCTADHITQTLNCNK